MRKNAAKVQTRQVEEILRRWDPIGVEPGTMAPLDEYDSYAPHIVSLVEGGRTIAELAAHLEDVAVSTIGVRSNPERSAQFAAEIMRILRPSNNSLERTRER